MTGLAERQEAYLAAFARRPRDAKGQPWLTRLRQEAIERFAELGFPTTHDEEWRFTSVAPIARAEFEPARAVRVAVPQVFDDAGCIRIVFVNGHFAPELSTGTAPSRSRLGEALDRAEEHLGRYASFRDHAFVALNTALFDDGAFVEVPANTVLDKPLHLVFMSAGQAPLRASSGLSYVSHPRNLILFGPNSQGTVIESYVGSGAYFTNAVTEIVVGDNAIVDHYKLQDECAQAFHVATLAVQQGRSSNFASRSFSFGGALVRNDVNPVLAEGAECTLQGLYVVNGTQHIDNHTIIDHAKPHATSHELYKGILDGRSSAVFNGKIIVRQDAQKTDAKQTNKNLVLSEDATINTKPQLEIFADDVRCTHGATIGQLDAEALFYLRARGIPGDEARDVLTAAFARDVIEHVKVDRLRERLEQKLYTSLAQRDAARE